MKTELLNQIKPRKKPARRSLGWWLLAVAVLALLALIGLRSSLVVAEAIEDTTLVVSNPEKAATGVEYKLRFTAQANGTDTVVLDFCANSVLINDNCTAPAGLSLSSVSIGGGATVQTLGAHTAMVELGVVADQGDTVDLTLLGIDNPSNPGALYLRFATYMDSVAASQYLSGTPGNLLDYGGVIATISDGVGVVGDVPEVLEFCTSGSSFDKDGCKGLLVEPKLKLGSDGVLSEAVSTARVYTRLSTNALHGAAVSLRSNAEGCGGLIRRGGESACDIEPLTTPGELGAGAARFGLKLGTIDRSSKLSAKGSYSSSDYYLNYQAGDATGVTSPLGDVIYGASEPVPGGIVSLTFAASKAPTTPAGDYFVDINLIATGTF